MINVPEMIKEKVVYKPHDGVTCDHIIIGDTKFNHIEIVRLNILLDQICFGTRGTNDKGVSEID